MSGRLKYAQSVQEPSSSEKVPLPEGRTGAVDAAAPPPPTEGVSAGAASLLGALAPYWRMRTRPVESLSVGARARPMKRRFVLVFREPQVSLSRQTAERVCAGTSHDHSMRGSRGAASASRIERFPSAARSSQEGVSGGRNAVALAR